MYFVITDYQNLIIHFQLPLGQWEVRSYLYHLQLALWGIFSLKSSCMEVKCIHAVTAPWFYDLNQEMSCYIKVLICLYFRYEKTKDNINKEFIVQLHTFTKIF